jgi:hypothetical protein
MVITMAIKPRNKVSKERERRRREKRVEERRAEEEDVERLWLERVNYDWQRKEYKEKWCKMMEDVSIKMNDQDKIQKGIETILERKDVRNRSNFPEWLTEERRDSILAFWDEFEEMEEKGLVNDGPGWYVCSQGSFFAFPTITRAIPMPK